MGFRQAVGLIGIVLAAMAAQLNDVVVNTALPDVTGGLGIGDDTATWLRTRLVTGEVVGMSIAPSLGIGFSFRRFTLFVIALTCGSSIGLAACGDGVEAPVLILRLLQGLGLGLTIPLLLTLALRTLTPDIKLYGLAVYALTATLVPNLSASFAALWINSVGNWRFVFLQSLPIDAAAAVCVWWGLPPEPPRWDRLRQFDWPGLLLVATGFGSLSIVLEQGDRLDWFNSPLIATLTLVSAVAVPGFLLVERVMPVPLVRLDLLRRRNFGYAALVLLVFLIVSLSAGQVPLMFLEQVRGYKPVQFQNVELAIAGSQLVLLPFTAWLLDHERVDARWINAIGFACIAPASLGAAQVTSEWSREQFWAWEALQAIGSAFVVMPLLMLATNALSPEDGPFGSALINTPRAVAEGVGVWALQLIARWRGGLHRDRIVDLIGQNRLVLDQLAAGRGAGPAAGTARSTRRCRGK